MVDTPGRCRELDYCSIGQMRTLVDVPLGQPFVCPECGKPLHAPPAVQPGPSRRRVAAYAGGATFAAAALLYASLGSSHANHHRIQLALQDAPPANLASANLAPAPLPPPPLRILATGQSAPAAVPEVVSLTPTLPTLWVAETAAAPLSPPPLASLALHTLSAGQSAPAAVLQVVSLTPTLPTLSVAGTAPARPPLPLPAPRETAATPPAPSPGLECVIDAEGVPTKCIPATHPAGPQSPAAAELSPPPALPKRAPPDRGFSPATVAGGAPPYPTDYVHDRRIGEVSLTCTIDPAGEPTHCKIHDLEGGRRFAEATVNWLNSGAAHYAPVLRLGRPISQEEHWTISFRPPR